MKVLPAPMSTTPASPCVAAISVKACNSPWRTAWEPAFTGGLSMVTTAMSSVRAQVITIYPLNA